MTHVCHLDVRRLFCELITPSVCSSILRMIGDIRQHLQASPFEPFTIVTSSGRRYPVPSADHAGLNPGNTRVVVWFDDDASVTVAALHISSLEKGVTSSQGNGEQVDGPNGDR